MYQVRLHSGYGVRYKEIPPTQRSKLLLQAGKLVGEEATFLELRAAEHEMGCKAMLKEITREKVASPDDLIKPETKWRPLSALELDENYDKLFTSKDHAVISTLYRRLHECDVDELEAIVGKAQPVAEG